MKQINLNEKNMLFEYKLMYKNEFKKLMRQVSMHVFPSVFALVKAAKTNSRVTTYTVHTYTCIYCIFGHSFFHVHCTLMNTPTAHL